MSEEIPGMFTVQLYSKSGIARVVGVIDEKIQKSLISYILEMKGEKENDYWDCSLDRYRHLPYFSHASKKRSLKHKSHKSASS